MAEMVLPRAFVRLFRDMPNSTTVQGTTVAEAFRELDRRYPGAWDRLCESGPMLRRHVCVFVDGERGTLESPVDERTEILIVPAVSGG